MKEAGTLRRRLVGNMLALFTLQGANYILPLITVPYLVRVLGADNYGRIAFAQAFIQFFVVLTNYGFNLSATRAVAQVRADREALSRLASAVMLIKTGLMVAGFVLMLSIVWAVPVWRGDWQLYALVYLLVLGHVLFPEWLFQGLESMRHITIFNVAARTISVLAIFLLVHHPSDYKLAAGLQAGGMTLAGVMGLAFLPRVVSLRWHWPGMAEIRHQLVEGWHVFLSTASISLYTSSNVFFLGLLGSPTVVGYFAAAEKLINAAKRLVEPVGKTVYPHIAKLRDQSREEALSFISRLLKWQGAASLSLSVLALALAPILVPLVLGPKMGPSVVVVQWLSPLPFLIGVSNVFGVQTMLNFDLKVSFSRILLASGVINTGLILPLAYWLGAEGAAISVLVTEAVVTIVMAWVLAKRGLLHSILNFKTGLWQTSN